MNHKKICTLVVSTVFLLNIGLASPFGDHLDISNMATVPAFEGDGSYSLDGRWVATEIEYKPKLTFYWDNSNAVGDGMGTWITPPVFLKNESEETYPNYVYTLSGRDSEQYPAKLYVGEDGMITFRVRDGETILENDGNGWNSWNGFIDFEGPGQYGQDGWWPENGGFIVLGQNGNNIGLNPDSVDGLLIPLTAEGLDNGIWQDWIDTTSQYFESEYLDSWLPPAALGPLNDPDQDSEGGVIFEQARELNIGLEYRDGLWVPVQTNE
jgi:hypothetical protein